MCVIIQKPAGVELPLDIADNIYGFNPHAWGFAVRDSTGISADKGLDYPSELRPRLQHLAAYEAIIHFRLRTSGGFGLELAHPFQVGPNTFLFHNGSLVHTKVVEEDDSDTARMAASLRDFLWDNEDVIHNPGFPQLIYPYVRQNRIVLASTKRFLKVSDRPWLKVAGCYFSNDYRWNYHLVRKYRMQRQYVNVSEF